jgi:hypothetical protein
MRKKWLREFANTHFFYSTENIFFILTPNEKKKQVKKSHMFLSKDLLLRFSNKNEVFKGTKTFEK